MSNTVTITRKFEFDAAHRVLGHKGKCRHLHGHRYIAEIAVSVPKLDHLGMVVDFADMKAAFGKWIDDNWDHNIILNIKDPLAEFYIRAENDSKQSSISVDPTEIEWYANGIFNGRRPYIMYENPTVENMVKVLFNALKNMVQDTGLSLEKIRMYETPNCWADYCETIDVDIATFECPVTGGSTS